MNEIKSVRPDILDCLANLSSDEVFTPPKVVNEMLDMLPQELFRSSKTTFLDIGCKSGVFLREITKRLIAGLADEMQAVLKENESAVADGNEREREHFPQLCMFRFSEKHRAYGKQCRNGGDRELQL